MEWRTQANYFVTRLTDALAWLSSCALRLAFRVPSLQPVQDGDEEELAEFAPSQGTEAEAIDDEV